MILASPLALEGATAPSDGRSGEGGRPDGFLIALGNRVRQARENAGLSQAGLAEAAALTRSYVASIERGEANPSALVLRALGAALGMEAAALLPPNAAHPAKRARRPGRPRRGSTER